MKPVTKSEFFKVVGPLNVATRVDVSSFKTRWHVSDWFMLDGMRKLIGRTETDGYGLEPTKFFLI